MDLRNKTVLKHYESNFEQLCKSLERKAGGWHNAEDVVQEAYYRSLKHFKSFSSVKGSFDLWFPAILSNCLRSHLRAEQLKGACIINDEDAMEQPREGTQESTVFADQVRQLLLSTENPETKVCLSLYYFEGLPPSDISKITELSVSNIRVIVHRFQQEVRRICGKEATVC